MYFKNIFDFNEVHSHARRFLGDQYNVSICIGETSDIGNYHFVVILSDGKGLSRTYAADQPGSHVFDVP